MLTISKKIWISFILVLGIGTTLSAYIFISGREVVDTTRDLVREQLPRLAQIKALNNAITEHERTLYEYYATTNRDAIWPDITKSEETFYYSLQALIKSFEGQIMALPNIYMGISKVRTRLDENLSKNTVNWDMAREDLSQLTTLGLEANVILDSLTSRIEREASVVAENTENQVENITLLVIGFSILIIIIAAFVGYYTNLNIREGARKRELALFPERNPNPVISLNWQGSIKFCNPACNLLLKKLNFREQEYVELLPQNFFDRLVDAKKRQMQQVSFKAEIPPMHLDYNMSLFRDLEICHLYIEDITQQVNAEKQLKFQAYHDLLTGLSNRLCFETDLEAIINSEKNCSILFISIDRFRLIVSTQGFDIGDKIITSMSERLKEQVLEFKFLATVYRLEGSTFCILISNSDPQQSESLANDIQQSMDRSLNVNEHKFYLTLSIGICHKPTHGNEAPLLISRGNTALNHAKMVGDQIEIYHSETHSTSKDWLEIESNLRRALANDEFLLYYQGKVNTHSNTITAAEALIRWKDNSGNIISPGYFIPVAEQTGLIIRIGQWVLDQAFMQSRLLVNKGNNINIAINLSARQFQHRHFLSNLKNSIRETQVDPTTIELEITESLIMEHADQSINIMKKLRDMGFTLAIDDFGTGYSSLSYLKKFPISTLKIDQIFVKNLENDVKDQKIIQSIVDLAKHLNLKTVAEGVETQGQLSFIRSLGCDFIQGYIYSKPDTADKLTQGIINN